MKADPDLRRIPVVILTTSDLEADVVKSYDLYANCYIVKPVDLDAVHQRGQRYRGLLAVDRQAAVKAGCAWPMTRWQVLLIEDNPGDIRLVNEALSDARLARWRLSCRETLAEGLALLGEENFARCCST